MTAVTTYISDAYWGGHCRWCSNWDGKLGTKVYHEGVPCPYVKEIEFYESGQVKRVVFDTNLDIEYGPPDEDEYS